MLFRSINDNNPCAYPRIAAAAANDAATTWDVAGAQLAAPGGATTANDARLFSGAVTGNADKIVTIPQGTNNLLDASKTYAVCYATGNGDQSDTTWADSYARYKITEIEALAHHSVLHVTNGMLPNTASMNLGYSAAECATCLLDASGNAVSTNMRLVGMSLPDGATFRPCGGAGAPATFVAGSTVSDEVTSQSSTSRKLHYTFDTSTLDTGSISGAGTLADPYVLTEQKFAVCYKRASGPNQYIDTGIRVTISKLKSILHGENYMGTQAKRTMLPVEAAGPGSNVYVGPSSTWTFPSTWATATHLASQTTGYQGFSPGLANARNVLPQMANEKIVYTADESGNDMAEKYVSLVDASLNGYKPCALNTEAAASADSQHSGAILSTTNGVSNEYEIVIPQATALDETKVFAVCYAISTGTAADTTWADSYVRVTISQVKSITSLGVTHSVSAYDGQIASRRDQADSTKDSDTFNHVSGSDTPHNNYLDLTYTGTLGSTQSLAMVDEELNGGFPCATDFAMGGQTATSGPAATSSTNQLTGAVVASGSTALMITDTLSQTKNFAFCYLHANGEWYDTGLRVTR